MTEHIHGSGCINTYPDCAYPDDICQNVACEFPHYNGRHIICTIPACENPTDRKGQPCDPCDVELGVGA